MSKHPRRESARLLQEEAHQSSESDSDTSADDESSADLECERLQSLIMYPPHTSGVDSPPTSGIRYHGKSSQTSLIKATRQLKELRLQEVKPNSETSLQCQPRAEFWSPSPVSPPNHRYTPVANEHSHSCSKYIYLFAVGDALGRSSCRLA